MYILGFHYMAKPTTAETIHTKQTFLRSQPATQKRLKIIDETKIPEAYKREVYMHKNRQCPDKKRHPKRA